jgi:hypothetical protein
MRDLDGRAGRRTLGMRALLLVSMLAVAGCGGVATEPNSGHEGRDSVAGLGLALELPVGWNGRILQGIEDRPVLHAASFPLSPNDDDSGEIARETIGGPGQIYVNVRDLGPGQKGSPMPVVFRSSDFGPPPPGPGSRCCLITVAPRDVSVAGHLYRVTVTSGSDERPSAAAVTEVNAVLSTLSIRPYAPKRPIPAEGGEQLRGYGINLTLPPGWQGRISNGKVEAASFDLGNTTHTDRASRVPHDGIALQLSEQSGSDVAFVTARLPFQLAGTEFVAPQPRATEHASALTGRSFVTAGRQFVLWAIAGSLPPSSTALAEANGVLATLRIEPGDFYPGRVDPATFAVAPGWSSGTSGSAELEPGGEQTTSWASTAPYRDQPDQFPPHKTLAALPPEGIVIVVWLSRHPGSRSRLPRQQAPFKIAHTPGSFEGVPSSRATYGSGAHVKGRFDVTLWVFFGRTEPTTEQLDRAQAEVDRLQLPNQ